MGKSPFPAKELRNSARLFAALGDQKRLRLVARLSQNGPASIKDLTEGFTVTRQAITKHLRQLETSGLVCSKRHGRKSLWELDGRRLEETRCHLDAIAKQWDRALLRLQRFVETAEPRPGGDKTYRFQRR